MQSRKNEISSQETSKKFQISKIQKLFKIFERDKISYRSEKLNAETHALYYIKQFPLLLFISDFTSCAYELYAVKRNKGMREVLAHEHKRAHCAIKCGRHSSRIICLVEKK